ncbi:MAG: glycerol-3-phosphate 1-O-acyltransferase PlsY [Candidatus Competibacterales bacterium]|nr:glycerol-3-phosphate 1-O-acyltransferase PlsY [Candidatus Competibacterales bacterium]
MSIALIVGAYLLGSIASAIVVCRLLGLPDPRLGGSGNPGATNVLRLGGRKAAAVTLLGDVLKGVLPVALAQALAAPPAVLAATALAAFLGHLFPVFFGFRGGKGVATAFGALLALAPVAALVALLVWLAVAALARFSSLASLSACVAAPLYLWWAGAPGAYAAALTVMAVLLIWRHRGNIQRLLSGRESRIGQKA